MLVRRAAWESHNLNYIWIIMVKQRAFGKSLVKKTKKKKKEKQNQKTEFSDQLPPLVTHQHQHWHAEWGSDRGTNQVTAYLFCIQISSAHFPELRQVPHKFPCSTGPGCSGTGTTAWRGPAQRCHSVWTARNLYGRLRENVRVTGSKWARKARKHAHRHLQHWW